MEYPFDVVPMDLRQRDLLHTDPLDQIVQEVENQHECALLLPAYVGFEDSCCVLLKRVKVQERNTTSILSQTTLEGSAKTVVSEKQKTLTELSTQHSISP